MQITATLNLGAEEKKELARILGCKPADLSATLAPYALAAIEEFVSMFLGQKVFTRGSDLLEHRLLLLIKHAFGGRIPNEQDVCKLFQMTSTASRSLIRAVMSKYQYVLKSEIEGTLKRLIEAAEFDGDGQQVTMAVHSLNLVEELNRELAEIDSNLPSVQKKKGSVSTFVLQPSSYTRLCGRFQVNAKSAR